MDVQVVLRFDNLHDRDQFFAVGGASSGVFGIGGQATNLDKSPLTN
jgi:hypothetical protein